MQQMDSYRIEFNIDEILSFLNLFSDFVRELEASAARVEGDPIAFDAVKSRIAEVNNMHDIVLNRYLDECRLISDAKTASKQIEKLKNRGKL